MRASAKIVFLCDRCGAESVQWHGQCPACHEWNTLVEFKTSAQGSFKSLKSHPCPGSLPYNAQPVSLPMVDVDAYPRKSTGIQELDRVLGGGLVPGSLILLAGDPGIGKSTLLLQAANGFASLHGSCLYISGEESVPQVARRSRRLGMSSSEVLLLLETEIGAIETQAQQISPQLLIVDSIQSLISPEIESLPGSVSQVRDCATRLLRLAKELALPTILVGHVTKEGAIAGPRLLEHMVDTVLSLEGDNHSGYRALRAIKNRFGSSDELGLFQMTETGMEAVPDASTALLLERRSGTTGSSVIAALEGSRCLLVEIQALVTHTASYGTPRRSVNGLDYNRACLIMAVLEKRLGIPLAAEDVYINVPGGIRITEPAADLGLALALVSSYREAPIEPKTAIIGEVGLTGEIRSVSNISKRLTELARYGFTRCLLPPRAASQQITDITLVAVENLDEACRAGF